MATSGAIPGTTDHQYIEVEIDWAVNWSDSSTNRTSLYVELRARRTNTGYTTSGTFTGGLTVAGSSVGSTSVNVSITNAWIRLTSGSIEVAHNADGTLSVPISAWGGIPGTGWNTTNAAGTAVLNRLLTIPPKPTAVTPVRNSDTQFTVGITHGTVGARNPIYSTQLQRRTVSTPAADWAYLMNTAGAVTSYVDGSTVTNSAYVYRANTWNDAGNPGWRESATVYTTPGAPSSVTAAKNVDLSITVNWVSGTNYTPTSFQIRDNGTLVATVAGSVLTWTHASPNASVSHTYTVAAVQGSLTSAWVASNTVQLLTPPLAPSGLTPSGTNVAVGAVPLSWTHNPVDSTPQTAANIRYRIVGAGTWTTTTATTSQQVQPTLTVGNYEWQVQTRGADPTYGPWSALATFAVVAIPTLTVTAPPTPLAISVVTASWTWAQAQGLAQTAWVARLETSAGALVETRSGTGATATTTFATRVANATNYRVVVTASNGALSVSTTRAFTTAFAPPATPVASVIWDETNGLAVLTVQGGAGGGVATINLSVERSVNLGQTWELVTESLSPAVSTLSDPECLSAGVTQYRITAFSATPSLASLILTLTNNSPSLWVGGGPGFRTQCRLPYDPTVGIDAGRQKAMFVYAGRSYAVPYSGPQLSRVVRISGTFFHNSKVPAAEALSANLDALIGLAQEVAAVHCYRDPDGNRIYGQLAEVSTSRPPGPGVWSYSTQLTESERR